MDQHEIELIQRAQAGDASAFEELVSLHDRRMLQVAHGILGNMQDAYDAYQNTLVRAYTRIDTFRFESAFSTWLTRIAINQALNFRKKLRWKKRLSLEMLNHTSAEPTAAGPAEKTDYALMKNEFSGHIEQSMERLSDRERAVFVLKHLHGYKIREIAVMLECAEGTVKNYLFRAVKKMRTALQPYYEDSMMG